MMWFRHRGRKQVKHNLLGEVARLTTQGEGNRVEVEH